MPRSLVASSPGGGGTCTPRPRPPDSVAVATARGVAPAPRVVARPVLEDQAARRVRTAAEPCAVPGEREQRDEEIPAQRAPTRLDADKSARCVELIARGTEQRQAFATPGIGVGVEKSPDHRPYEPELCQRDLAWWIDGDGHAVVGQVAQRLRRRCQMVVVRLAVANPGMPVSARAVGRVRDPQHVAPAQPPGHRNDGRVS